MSLFAAQMLSVYVVPTSKNWGGGARLCLTNHRISLIAEEGAGKERRNSGCLLQNGLSLLQLRGVSINILVSSVSEFHYDNCHYHNDKLVFQFDFL